MKHKWEMYAGRKFIDSGTIEAESETAALNMVLLQEAEKHDADTSYTIKVGASSASSYGDEFERTAGASYMDDTNLTPSGHSFAPVDWTGCERSIRDGLPLIDDTEVFIVQDGDGNRMDSEELDEVAKRFRDDFSDVARKIADDIVARMPVDTGLARKGWDLPDADPVKDIHDAMRQMTKNVIRDDLNSNPSGKSITSVKPKVNFQQMSPTAEEARIASDFSLKGLMKKFGMQGAKQRCTSTKPASNFPPFQQMRPSTPSESQMERIARMHAQQMEDMKYSYALSQGVPIEQVHTTIIHDEVQYSIKP